MGGHCLAYETVMRLQSKVRYGFSIAVEFM